MDGKKVILVIMDGWGLGKVPSSDAILQADTPFVDSLYKKYPNNILITCGEAVGLPPGQMGNSEVGHLNIGAAFRYFVFAELSVLVSADADCMLTSGKGEKDSFNEMVFVEVLLYLLVLV